MFLRIHAFLPHHGELRQLGNAVFGREHVVKRNQLDIPIVRRPDLLKETPAEALPFPVKSNQVRALVPTTHSRYYGGAIHDKAANRLRATLIHLRQPGADTAETAA